MKEKNYIQEIEDYFERISREYKDKGLMFCILAVNANTGVGFNANFATPSWLERMTNKFLERNDDVSKAICNAVIKHIKKNKPNKQNNGKAN